MDSRLGRLLGRKLPIVSSLAEFLTGVLDFTKIFDPFLVLVIRLSEGSSKYVVSSARKLSLPTGVLTGPKPVGKLIIGLSLLVRNK